MRVIIQENYDRLSAWAANYIVNNIKKALPLHLRYTVARILVICRNYVIENLFTITALGIVLESFFQRMGGRLIILNGIIQLCRLISFPVKPVVQVIQHIATNTLVFAAGIIIQKFLYGCYGSMTGLLIQFIPVCVLVQTIQPQKTGCFGKGAAWKDLYELSKVIFGRNKIIQVVIAQSQVKLKGIVS